MVAFERLEVNAIKMLNQYGDFNRPAFFRALMCGLIDAFDQGCINLDMKLDNMMIESVYNRMQSAIWKIIDWDIWIKVSVKRAGGGSGTRGYKAPGE